MSIDGSQIHIDGAGPRTLVMVHGWPDTWRLWDAQVPYFVARGWRCVRFTLPGFDRTLARRGHSLDELVGFLSRVVDAVSPSAPVALMLHDWGCVFGYQFALRHADRVAAVVGVDIGDSPSRQTRASLSVRAKALVAAYQLWLALAWRLSGWGARGPADAMTRWMARSMGCPSDPSAIGACMNYPYDTAWTGSHGGFRHLRPLDALALPWPLFYAWGARKPMMFHSPQWLRDLDAQPRHRTLRFECGHWVMVRRADAFNAAAAGWLDETVVPR